MYTIFFLQNYKVIEKDLRERQKRQEREGKGKDKDKGPQDMYIGKRRHALKKWD